MAVLKTHMHMVSCSPDFRQVFLGLPTPYVNSDHANKTAHLCRLTGIFIDTICVLPLFASCGSLPVQMHVAV